MKQLGLIIFSCLWLAACNCTYQYKVNVKNETGGEIKVSFKSINDAKGIVENTVVLKQGETKEIISTKDMDTGNGCPGCKAEDCKMVAEYVTAYNHENKPSKIKWCDPQIDFLKSDVQQAEYTITYTSADF